METKTGIKVEAQRLIYMARALADNQKLSDIIKDNDQTIHLIAKQEQAPPQPEPRQERPAPQEGQGIFGQLSNLISGMLGQGNPVASQIILEGPEVTYQRFEMPLPAHQHHAPPAGDSAQGNMPHVNLF